MSHKINCRVMGEFRRAKENKRNTAEGVRAYRSLVFEDAEGEPVEVNVKENELWEDCQRLRKGSIYVFPLLVVAGMYQGRAYDYINLTDSPTICADEEGEVL